MADVLEDADERDYIILGTADPQVMDRLGDHGQPKMIPGEANGALIDFLKRDIEARKGLADVCGKTAVAAADVEPGAARFPMTDEVEDRLDVFQRHGLAGIIAARQRLWPFH